MLPVVSCEPLKYRAVIMVQRHIPSLFVRTILIVSIVLMTWLATGFPAVRLTVPLAFAGQPIKIAEPNQQMTPPISPMPYRNLTASELRDDQGSAIENLHPPQMVLLDVRTGLEYRWKHIPGAVRLTRQQVLQQIPKDRPVTVICLSGHRSIPVAKWLTQQGYQSIYNLSGGFWTWWRAGYPTVSGSTPD